MPKYEELRSVSTTITFPAVEGLVNPLVQAALAVKTPESDDTAFIGATNNQDGTVSVTISNPTQRTTQAVLDALKT